MVFKFIPTYASVLVNDRSTRRQNQPNREVYEQTNEPVMVVDNKITLDNKHLAGRIIEKSFTNFGG